MKNYRFPVDIVRQSRSVCDRTGVIALMTTDWGDWKRGSGKCDTVKIARVENAGVSRMERQYENILRKP